ncbi:Cro/Cl family transcriptional regulator, partial [Vibrio cholerae]|nr:Cro/Cl family transcriptional regulator [Vibrio cholerae]
AEWTLEMIENGTFKFNDEEQKVKFIEAQKKIIKEKSAKAGLIRNG